LVTAFSGHSSSGDVNLLDTVLDTDEGVDDVWRD
jgi:hypothetical protein